MNELLEFANLIDKILEIRSRPNTTGKRKWVCVFSQGWVKKGDFLVNMHGNGNTPDAAILAYAQNIAGKTLIFGTNEGNREEYPVPEDLGQEPAPIYGGKL